MGVVIVVPGIALAGILGADGLSDPDQAFPYIVSTYLPVGIKGLILCALFASLMSTVDSMFNSLATIWSIDLYKAYLRPAATDTQVVRAGKRAILVALITGVMAPLQARSKPAQTCPDAWLRGSASSSAPSWVSACLSQPPADPGPPPQLPRRASARLHGTARRSEADTPRV